MSVANDSLLQVFTYKFITTTPNKQDIVTIVLNVLGFHPKDVMQTVQTLKGIKMLNVTKANNNRLIITYDMIDYKVIRREMQDHIGHFVSERYGSEK